MATVVSIYLSIGSETIQWIKSLSIPCEDIQRFTYYPLKWLCFATFTVCGAKGHLSSTPGGEGIDYEDVSFDNIADKYYYVTSDAYHFVDHQVFNGYVLPNPIAPQISKFSNQICKRDGHCVFTQAKPNLPQAAHIIAQSKGHNYITFVIHDRLHLYPGSFSNEDDINVNCVQNGIYLRADLDGNFGQGEIVFLKTPNFFMAPSDVPQAEMDDMPTRQTTLQYMRLPGKYDIPQVDAKPLSGWQEEEEPSSLLLDFVYGAAVAKHWMSNDLLGVLEKHFQDAFKPVLPIKPETFSPGDDLDEFEDDPDNPKDLDYKPSGSKDTGYKMDHMDRVLALSWLLKGVTPQSLAEEAQKQEQERELHAQKHSCDKVQQWLNSGASTT